MVGQIIIQNNGTGLSDYDETTHPMVNMFIGHHTTSETNICVWESRREKREIKVRKGESDY